MQHCYLGLDHSMSQQQQEAESPRRDEYKVWGMPHSPEDIVLCVDVDAQVDAELKVTGSKGQALTRLDAVKQALLLFVHSKLVMSREHRFAIATIGQSASWHLHQFSSDYEGISAWVRSLSSQGSYEQCDLSSLFNMILPDARASKQHKRCFRVVLIYCRSDVVPSFSTTRSDPHGMFTFDALYLHDKPNSQNWPQKVYDVLVEALERVSSHGYIYESGSGLSRVLFKQMGLLLAHPQQRCLQDDFNPRDLAKPAADGVAVKDEESAR